MQGRLVRTWFGSPSLTLTAGRDNAAIALLSSQVDPDIHTRLFVLHFDEDAKDDDTDEYDDDFEEDVVGFLTCGRVIDVVDAIDLSKNIVLCSCFDFCGSVCLLGQDQLTRGFWLAVWTKTCDEPVIEDISIPLMDLATNTAKAVVAVHTPDCWAVVLQGSLFMSPVCSSLFTMPALSAFHSVAFSVSGDLFVAGTLPSSEKSQAVYNKDGKLIYRFEGEPITLLSVSEDGSLFCCVDAGGVVHTNDAAFVPVGPFGVEVGRVDSVCCTNTRGVYICERGAGVHRFI